MAKRQSAYTQLLATKRARSKGTLARAMVELWRAIRAAAACLDGAMADDDDDRVLKACHAIAQLSSVYSRLSSDHELEERLQALESERLDNEKGLH